jgi:hypothetical protein
MSKVTLRRIASGRTPHSECWPHKADGTDRTDELRCEPADDGDVDVAWASPGFWSQGFLPVPKTGVFDDAQPQDLAFDASVSSACNAASQATSTRGCAATRISTHAARSSIHAGSSSQRSKPASSRLQRTTTSAAFSITSWTQTTRPNHGARDSAPCSLRSCGRSVVALRPHNALGYEPPERFGAPDRRARTR